MAFAFSAAATATVAFTFDGTSSDLAQQFHRRSQAGDSADKLPFKHAAIPEPIKKRLDTLTLKFESLDGLLQRALLWDSGYVLGPVSQLIKVYTKPSTTMADIAVSTSEFNQTGCTNEECTDSLGQLSLRSKFCTGTAMLTAAKCMSEDFAGEDHQLSMWATGGRDRDIPEPNFIRHEWVDNSTVYIVLSIHMAQFSKQPHWGLCALDDKAASYSAAMVVPCGVYQKSASSSSSWVEPVPTQLVTDWLETFAKTAKPIADDAAGGEASGSNATRSSSSKPAATPSAAAARLEAAIAVLVALGSATALLD